MRTETDQMRVLELHRFTASQKIAEIEAPITPEQRNQLLRMIELEGFEYEGALELDCIRRLEAATGEATHFKSRLESCRLRTQQLAAAVAKVATDYCSFSRSALYLLAFSSAVVTEYAFNASAFTYIMSLKRGTFMATAVAFTVAMSILALDEPLRKLIAEPAEEGRSLRARAAFLIALGIVNLVSLGLLGEARAIGFNFQRSTSANVQQAGTITMLVLIVTLVVALNGALFWQVGRAEAARLWFHFKAHRIWKKAEREERAAEEQARDAVAVIAPLQKEAQDEERRSRLAEHLRHEKTVELLFAEERTRLRAETHKDLVDRLLVQTASGRAV